MPRPGRFTPGKERRYPFYVRLDGPQSWSGQVRKISSTPGFDPRTVQPVAKLTEWSVRKSLPDDDVDIALRLHTSPNMFIRGVIDK